jgi:hypothetical protein
MVNGMAEAAGWTTLTSVLIQLYPHSTSLIMSTLESVFGLGLMLGKTTT